MLWNSRTVSKISWEEALQNRCFVDADPTAESVRKFREELLNDKGIARRRMKLEQPRHERGADVAMGSGIPHATTHLGRSLRNWCQYNSWGLCIRCGLTIPRTMTESTLMRKSSVYISRRFCPSCRATREMRGPQPDNVPLALRNLNDTARKALSPLTIDVGPEIRATSNPGYRQRITLIRFCWNLTSVTAQIEAIGDDVMRARARDAYEFLISNTKSSYACFVEEHKAFLQSHENPDWRQCRRRLAFIENVGLECALWPTLFWITNMTFTYERATDIRRSYTDTLENVMRPEEDEDEEINDEDFSRHSIRQWFCSLAMGNLLGYASQFELLQFVYDLTLWSSLGAQKNTAQKHSSRTPMRIMTAGASFTPLYWKRVSAALVDVVRQLGAPRFFFTLAPYGRTAPYHVLVLDEMQKTLRKRLRLPIMETLHIANVLIQIAKSFLVGGTSDQSQDSRRWKHHLLNCGDRKVYVFIRLEFQDGSRKAPTKDYHGSGRVHLHMLGFADAEQMMQIPWSTIVTGLMPQQDTVLRNYVQNSQIDRDGQSGCIVHNEESTYSEERHTLLIAHDEHAQRAGLRPYNPAIMDAFPRHQDFQAADGEALLRNYMVKYCSKFSDSMVEECLNDDADATSIAVNVLMRYKPFEPEMILQLFGNRFRQWHISTYSGGKRDFVVPVPDKEFMPQEVTHYMNSTWACGTISLLDFLRKTNRQGHIVHWLKETYARTNRALTLHEFAAQYVCKGEQAVAATIGSRLNDPYYGQWLMLHVPFRTPLDFVDETVLQKVPDAYRYFTMAYTSMNPIAIRTWHHDDVVEAECKLEGHTTRHINTILSMMRATRPLIDDYINGTLNAEEERLEIQAQEENVVNHDDLQNLVLSADQHRVEERVREFVTIALEVQYANCELDVDRAREKLLNENYIIAVCGPPGTGKTTLTHRIIQWTMQNYGRVLFTMPTNVGTARVRKKYGNTIDVSTCHAAFGFDEELPHRSMLEYYTLIAIDEISQIQGYQYDHVGRMWMIAERVTIIVVMGDKWQQASFGDERAWHTATWRRHTFKLELHTTYRCKDPVFMQILNELRTSMPSRSLLKVLRSKKAWTPPGKPTVHGLQILLHVHPNTTILTCTRRGAHEVNVLALQALYPYYPPLVVVDGDVETNPVNYERGQLKEPIFLELIQLPIFKGMRVVFTRNVRPDVDYVNGMDGIVDSWCSRSRAIRVRTSTGRLIAVWPYTDTTLNNIVYYQIRAGYAATTLKYAGAELEHVTLYLDAPLVPGAAYTGISRVATADAFLIGGLVTANHFAPVH